MHVQHGCRPPVRTWRGDLGQREGLAVAVSVVPFAWMGDGVPGLPFSWPGLLRACPAAPGGRRVVQGDPAGPENGLLTSRQLDVDDIKPGNAFKMADVRRCDAPACGDGRGGNDAVVRSDVRAGRGECCPQAGVRAGR